MFFHRVTAEGNVVMCQNNRRQDPRPNHELGLLVLLGTHSFQEALNVDCAGPWELYPHSSPHCLCPHSPNATPEVVELPAQIVSPGSHELIRFSPCMEKVFVNEMRTLH